MKWGSLSSAYQVGSGAFPRDRTPSLLYNKPMWILSIFRLDRKFQWIFTVLWVLWVLAVVYYYFGHTSPWDLPIESIRDNLGNFHLSRALFVLASVLKTLLLDSAFFVVFFALGSRIRHFIGLRENLPMIPILEIVLGMLGIQMVWLGLGLNRLWNEALLLPLGCLFLGFSLWEVSRGFFKRGKRSFPHPQTVFQWILGGLCLAMVLLLFAQAALPEVFFDALVYHLSVLRVWDLAGGITNLPTNLYSFFPFGGEMVFYGAFHWGSGEAVVGLNGMLLILTAGAAGTWAWEEAGPTAAYLAAGWVLSLPLMVAGAWCAQVDGLHALLTLLFFYCLSRYSQKGTASWIFMGGVLAGAALGVKYTAFLSLGVGLVVWGKDIVAKLRLKISWVLLGLIPLVVLFLPWLIKNWVYSGNPLYPYLGSWFHGLALPEGRMAHLMSDHIQALGSGESFASWIGRVFTRDLDKTVSPLLFSFLPLLFFGKDIKGQGWKILTVGWVSLFIELALSHQLRLCLVSIVVIIVGMSVVVGQVQEKGLGGLWKAVCVVVFVLNFLLVFRYSVNFFGSLKMWSGGENRDEYLARCTQTITFYHLAKDCGRWFSSDDLLLVAGDCRSLYYPQPVVANSSFDVPVLADLARKRKDGDGIALGLKEMGLEGLVVLKTEGIRNSQNYQPYALTDEQWARLDDFIQHHTRLVEMIPLGGIYRFSPELLPAQGPVLDLFLYFKNL